MAPRHTSRRSGHELKHRTKTVTGGLSVHKERSKQQHTKKARRQLHPLESAVQNATETYAKVVGSAHDAALTQVYAKLGRNLDQVRSEQTRRLKPAESQLLRRALTPLEADTLAVQVKSEAGQLVSKHESLGQIMVAFSASARQAVAELQSLVEQRARIQASIAAVRDALLKDAAVSIDVEQEAMSLEADVDELVKGLERQFHALAVEEADKRREKQDGWYAFLKMSS